MIVLKQMLIFFIMIVIGIIARKNKMITPENQGNLSALVVRITSPCLILSSAMSAGGRMPFSEIRDSYAAFFIVLIIALLAAFAVPKLLRYPSKQQSVANLMFWCTNIAFMGLPLVKGTYGDQAMIYVTLLLVPLNVLFYSYAIMLVSKEAEGNTGFQWKRLLNPGMAACILTCIIYFLQISVPYVIVQSVSMIGSITAPLSMMMIGASLLDVDFKAMLTDMKLYLFIFLKMLVFPILVLLVIKQFITNEYILGACLAFLATPTGGMVSMLAALYNKDSYLMTTQEIALSTLVSVVTLPIVAMVI